MKHIRTLSRIILTLGAMGAIAAMLLFIVGSIRYDGPNGLLRRVQAEIAAHQPHPDFVPTPLPTLKGQSAADVLQQIRQASDNASLAQITPTIQATPSPTPLPPTATEIIRTTHLSPTTSVDTPPPTPLKATPTASNTPAPPPPTPTPSPQPQTSVDSASTYQPPAESIALSGFTHLWQKWNNCGPATLAMNLSAFGGQFDQLDVAAVVKPNPDDKNVNPEELADFARSQGYQAQVRVNGNSELLQLFLSNGIPVLIETWLEPEPGDGMGHYRLITGYDNTVKQWIAYDSYVSVGVKPDQPYQGIRISYTQLDFLWSVFNNTYIIIYPESKAPIVETILGEANDPNIMWQQALQQAQQNVEQSPDDQYAWFNLGSSLVALGLYQEAAAAYDQARVIGLPWRMLWYQFGPFKAYYETERYEELLALTEATIATGGNIEEIYYWQGMGLAAQGQTEEARQAWQHAIELNSNYTEPVTALANLGVTQ